MYEVKVPVRAEIRTKHKTRREHHVEFLIINLLKPIGYVMHQQV